MNEGALEPRILSRPYLNAFVSGSVCAPKELWVLFGTPVAFSCVLKNDSWSKASEVEPGVPCCLGVGALMGESKSEEPVLVPNRFVCWLVFGCREGLGARGLSNSDFVAGFDGCSLAISSKIEDGAAWSLGFDAKRLGLAAAAESPGAEKSVEEGREEGLAGGAPKRLEVCVAGFEGAWNREGAAVVVGFPNKLELVGAELVGGFTNKLELEVVAVLAGGFPKRFELEVVAVAAGGFPNKFELDVLVVLVGGFPNKLELEVVEVGGFPNRFVVVVACLSDGGAPKRFVVFGCSAGFPKRFVGAFDCSAGALKRLGG